MMIEVGAFSAKTHFSEILKRVEQGESFCITNRGKKIAVLSSFEDKHKQKIKIAYGQLQALRRKHPVGSTKEVIAWKNEGRK
jgi:prevent-host-death family protein